MSMGGAHRSAFMMDMRSHKPPGLHPHQPRYWEMLTGALNHTPATLQMRHQFFIHPSGQETFPMPKCIYLEGQKVYRIAGSRSLGVF